MNSDGIIWSALATINVINLIAYVQRIARGTDTRNTDIFFTVLSAVMLVGSAGMLVAGL